MNTTKLCKKCSEEKSFTDFYTKKDSKDGYRNICKKCDIADKAARTNKGPQTTEQRRESQLKISEQKSINLKKFAQENKEYYKQLGASKKKAIKAVNPTGSVLEFESATAAEALGFDRRCISNAISKKASYKGYMWSFKNEE